MLSIYPEPAVGEHVEDFGSSLQTNKGHEIDDQARHGFADTLGHETITIRDAGNRGRGIFVERDIRAGDIIMREQAFAIADPPERRPTGLTKSESLSRKTIEALEQHPDRASSFLELFGGSTQDNCAQACFDTSKTNDRARVENILAHNRYTFDGKTDKTRDCCGIFVCVAYINHSCAPNAVRCFEDDTMVLRAARNIPKNEEVTVTYWGYEDDYTKRHEILLKNWAFDCDCILCTAEKATPAAQAGRRQAVLLKTQAFLRANQLGDPDQPDSATISLAQQLYQELQETYDPLLFHGVPRAYCADMGIWLARAHYLGFEPERALQAATEVLEHSGFRTAWQGEELVVHRVCPMLNSVVVDAAVYAAHAWRDLGDDGRAKQYEDLARELYFTNHGVLDGLFNRRYKL